MTEALTDAEVAERRQRLNEEAYFSVLKALLARGKKEIQNTIRLRKELNVSNMQHGQWVQELLAAVQGGPAAIEGALGPAAAAAAAAAAGTHATTAAAAAAGGGGRLARTSSMRSQGSRQAAAAGGSLARTGSRKTKGEKAAAAQQQQQQAQAGHPPPRQLTATDANMVGYRAKYYLESNRQWMVGAITDFDGYNIYITFNRGQPYEFTECVRWQQSERLQMLNEKEPGVEFKPRMSLAQPPQ